MADDEPCPIYEIDQKRLTHVQNLIKKLEKHVVYNTDGQPDPCLDKLNKMEIGNEEECFLQITTDVIDDMPEDTWHGHFKGYRFLTANIENNMNDYKKCVELLDGDCDETIEDFLRAGVNCFYINLFLDSYLGNRRRIQRLRKCEQKIAEDLGHPFMSTIIARLSPRLQFTGNIKPSVELKQGDKIILSTNRYWGSRGTKKRIFVNGRFMLPELYVCDIILIGMTIQVQIQQIIDLDMHCTVLRGGLLSSWLPVRFPGKCRYTHLSVEELEDIQLAKEMGIGVLVTPRPISKGYADNLRDCIQVLGCNSVRLFTRIVLNELHICDNKTDWIIDTYDGFIVEFRPQCHDKTTEILDLCQSAVNLIENSFEIHKPMILNPSGFLDKRILIHSDYIYHIFFCPEKYIFTCEALTKSFYFFTLQTAYFARIEKNVFSEFPFIRTSCLESDRLAHNCMVIAEELKPNAIFVCSLNGTMASKIAHFRPSIPIILICTSKCVGNFICLHHNVVMVLYTADKKDTYMQTIGKQLIAGLGYAKTRKMLQNGNPVLLVYGRTAPGNMLQDNYITYKFNQKDYAEHVQAIVYGHNATDTDNGN